MALGDLSSDQQRYLGAVVAGTGLDATVVRAWIGKESGWGVTKASHNYLNIGPGRTYTSTEQAAAAVARLINTSSYYAGIRAAIPAGPVAQVQAIQESPWDAARYGGNGLMVVYEALARAGAAGPVAAVPAQLAGIPNLGPHNPLLPFELPKLFGGLPGFVTEPLSDAGKAIVEQLLPGMLGLVFTLAAFGLIALGLARLTDRSPRDALGAVQSVVGGTQTAARAAAAL